jgi:DNA-binding response OmpR family regulator
MVQLTDSLTWNAARFEISRDQHHFVLRPIAARIFKYFLAHPNCIISTEQLATVGWPDMQRESTDVYKQIQWLRHCIERDPHHPQILRVHPGLGYELYLPNGRQPIKEETYV